MGAVGVVVKGIAVVIAKIPTVIVINKTISIVVNAIAKRFPSVHPHIGVKINMIAIDPSVDYSHNHPLSGVACTPCLWRANPIKAIQTSTELGG